MNIIYQRKTTYLKLCVKFSNKTSFEEKFNIHILVNCDIN